jgi:rhamnosyl/mannosyltransferase
MAPAYDILHVHMPNPLAALAVWFARPDARVVLHWHSDVVHQQRALKLYEPLQHWLLQRADRVIATSEAYADGSRVLGRFRDKVEAVPLGIGDNARFTDDRRVRAIREEFAGRKLVFALGRLVDYKGFDVLIDAAGQLPEDALVLVGGSGPLAKRLAMQVSMRGVGSRVRLLGRIDDDELMSYHSAADVFCLPSVNRAEAFGVAMLEAMSAGRPVICTQVEGSAMPWVNQHEGTGLVVAPGDASALAAALKRLLGDASLARRLGAGARERFLCEFQAATMVARIERLYQQLLGK